MSSLVSINEDERLRLIFWLTNPNGSHRVNDRLVLEAVGGGEVLVMLHKYEQGLRP